MILPANEPNPDQSFKKKQQLSFTPHRRIVTRMNQIDDEKTHIARELGYKQRGYPQHHNLQNKYKPGFKESCKFDLNFS
jgi:hypothetical protein